MSQFFSVSSKKNVRGVTSLCKQWPKRTNKLRAFLPYAASELTLQFLLEKIPKTEEHDAYRRSLEVVRVGHGDKLPIFAVRADPIQRKVRKVDVFKVLLYIRGRRKLGKVKKEVEILERFNPWTPDTIPFFPKKNEAVIISRKVSLREARNIADTRKQAKDAIRKQLAELGVKDIRKDVLMRIPRKTKTLPDVAFEALRLEFGIQGKEAKPHWRPSLRKLISLGVKDLIRLNKDLKRSQMKLAFGGWKRWPPKVRTTLRFKQALDFVPFQQKLGIRVS